MEASISTCPTAWLFLGFDAASGHGDWWVNSQIERFLVHLTEVAVHQNGWHCPLMWSWETLLYAPLRTLFLAESPCRKGSIKGKQSGCLLQNADCWLPERYQSSGQVLKEGGQRRQRHSCCFLWSQQGMGWLLEITSLSLCPYIWVRVWD